MPPATVRTAALLLAACTALASEPSPQAAAEAKIRTRAEKTSGNEVATARFLLENLGKVSLAHLGVVESVGAPNPRGGWTPVKDAESLALVSTVDPSKKADIYINGRGASLKQQGASFPFNRLQRAEILDAFRTAGIAEPEAKLGRLDAQVDAFHNGLLPGRRIPWQGIFGEEEFQRLVRFLMMEGSPNLGRSSHPAEFIVESPATGISRENIRAFTFGEYFDSFRGRLCIGIRRQWIGQASDSEHSRAVGMAEKPGNAQWVYPSISGEPRPCRVTGKRWRDGFPEAGRRTVYMVFIEKI